MFKFYNKTYLVELDLWNIETQQTSLKKKKLKLNKTLKNLI